MMEKENSTNPFEATAKASNVVRRHGGARAVMAAFSVGCYCLAGVLCFCSQSWTFYTHLIPLKPHGNCFGKDK